MKAHAKRVCIYAYLFACTCTCIDPYHSAAVLRLGGIKSFVFARQASARREFSARLTVQEQSFLFSGDSTWPPCDKRSIEFEFALHV